MAYTIEWDKAGERFYETGTDRGVLFPMTAGTYGNGVAWNGLTAVTESPSGAEASPLYADNIKYVELRSAEEFGFTIEAYTYPDEFAECDGTLDLGTATSGIKLGQQSRKPFGFTYRTKIGNDTDGDSKGYKLHLIYNSTASPSEKAYQTVNDSPEAITFSWEATSTPVNVTVIPNVKPVSCITIDSTASGVASFLAALEARLYGDGTTQAALPSPDEVIQLAVGTGAATGITGVTGITGF